MKVYIGTRLPDGSAHVDVSTGDRVKPLPLRLDLDNHSPDGFDWGYSGSGPAQLALAILADTLGAARARHRHGGWIDNEQDARNVAVRLHQDFKRQFIAGLARDQRWTITETTVREFIARFQTEAAL